MRHDRALFIAGICGFLLVTTAGLAAAETANEPMVIYDITGYGVGGPLHEHLTVYSSGLCAMSRPGAPDIESAFTFVPVVRVVQLAEDLLQAGALEMGDRPEVGADLPLHTLTVFSGPWPQAEYNTFSFYDPTQPRVDAIVAVMDAFILEMFGFGGAEFGREAASAPDLITLAFGQRSLFPAFGLVLEFVAVPSDSRCPRGVQCPWAGEVQVVVHIWHQGTDLGTSTFTYGAGSGSTVIVGGAYELELRAVRPEARLDPPIQAEEYRLLFQVRECGDNDNPCSGSDPTE